jgi:BirA family biotin operon repressor/biotin-[acetyl-CoA-carboxylase] ligase
LGRPSSDLSVDTWVWLHALTQNQGKGQGEKTFFSPPGGLYATLICLWPSVSFAPSLSLVVALAVATVLGPMCTLKWINDIYWGPHKIGGVLIHRHLGHGPQPCIISIGVNVNGLHHTTPDQRPITSLRLETGHTHDLNHLLGAIEKQLCAFFQEIIAHNGTFPQTLCQAINNRLTACGKKVRIQTQKGQVTGWCQGIGPSGRIILDGKNEYDVLGLCIVNEMGV